MLAVRKYSAYGCAEGNSGQDKPDRVKSVPPVAKVCPVRGKPLGRPRIDKLVDRVNPDGPNSHHEQDADAGKHCKKGLYWLPPGDDSQRQCGQQRRNFQPTNRSSIVA